MLGVAVVVSIGPCGSAAVSAAGAADRPVAPISRAALPGVGAVERASAGEVDRETVARWLAGVCQAERQWRRGGQWDEPGVPGAPADRAAGCDVGAMLRAAGAIRVDELDAPAPAAPIRAHLGDLSPPVC